MHAISHLAMSTLAAGLLLCASGAVAAPDPGRLCDYTDGQVCASSGGCYDAFWPLSAVPEQDEGICQEEFSVVPGTLQVKFLNPQPPGTARLVCEQVANCLHACQAYPQGSGITFGWSKTGRIYFDGMPGANDNYAMLGMQNQTGGTVSVNVYSPLGAYSTVSASISFGCIPQ